MYEEVRTLNFHVESGLRHIPYILPRTWYQVPVYICWLTRQIPTNRLARLTFPTTVARLQYSTTGITMYYGD